MRKVEKWFFVFAGALLAVYSAYHIANIYFNNLDDSRLTVLFAFFGIGLSLSTLCLFFYKK